MENLKIRVKNRDQVLVVHDLAKCLGMVKPYNNFTLHDGYVALDFEDMHILDASIEQCDSELNPFKEITIPELRKLAGRESLNDQYAEIEKVRQSMQKEYLVKTEDGEYHFVPKGQNLGPAGEWIEVPEGADAYIQYKTRDDKLFIKFGNPSQYWSDCRWCNIIAEGYETLQSFIDDGDKIIWRRDAGLSDDADNVNASEVVEALRMGQGDINYRAAKAFNEIKRANTLSEDDVRLVLELVQLVRVHG